MDKVLEFLVENKYACNIKGKSWWCGIQKFENSDVIYMVSYEMIFRAEMVKSVTIITSGQAIIELIH